jgi:hypothetical protein
MHRLTQDHLEEVLAGKLPAGHQVTAHLKDCSECREAVDAMQLHGELLRMWSVPAEAAELEPAPGFYARVLERIEATRPVSIWTLFGESFVGRYMLTASLAMAVLTVGFAVLTEEATPQLFLGQAVASAADPLYPSGFASDVMAKGETNNGAVLMSLVSYQGR